MQCGSSPTGFGWAIFPKYLRTRSVFMLRAYPNRSEAPEYGAVAVARWLLSVDHLQTEVIGYLATMDNAIATGPLGRSKPVQERRLGFDTSAGAGRVRSIDSQPTGRVGSEGSADQLWGEGIL